MNKKAKTLTKWIFLMLIITLIAVAHFKYDATMYLTHEKLTELVNKAGMLGPTIFMLIYFIAVLFLLPATVFTVLAGVLFGTLKGLIYVVIAATLAAQVAFYISRYYGTWCSNKFSKLKYTKNLAEKIEKQVEQDGFRAFFIMRCLFLPYIIFSYASGLIKNAKARDFFLATLITNAINSFAFVYLGNNVFAGPKALILPALLITVVLLIPRLIKKFKKNSYLSETGDI